MDLERQFLGGIKDFDEQRKAAIVQRSSTKHLRTVSLDEPLEIPACKDAISYNADIAGAITNFPRLAYRPRGRKSFAV